MHYLSTLFLFALPIISITATFTPYVKTAVIPFAPDPVPASIDQSVVFNGTYYLSDRTNAVVHAIDLATNGRIARITGFKGVVISPKTKKADTHVSGPNGLCLLPDRDELYVGDANGTIRVISMGEKKIVGKVDVGSDFRADEMAYDEHEGILVVTVPNEKPPSMAVVDVKCRKVVGHISFPKAEGLEQPVFDHISKTFYVSVPGPEGAITALNVKDMKIGHSISLPTIAPAGIAFGPKQNLYVGGSGDLNETNSLIVDLSTGKVVANIPGVAGSDQVAYDSKAGLYFASAYQNVGKPELAIIDAHTNTLVQTLETDDVLAHSVAVDSVTGKVLVPLKPAKGIQVYEKKK